jgi:tetratricopeptide (TPR) repeat protein
MLAFCGLDFLKCDGFLVSRAGDLLARRLAIKGIALIALSLFLTFSLAHGKEYGNYDSKKMLTVSESPSGKKYGIDVAYLDQMLRDLASHAQNYPPKFDTPEDQKRAVQDVKMLSGMLDIMVNGPNPNTELLWRTAFLNSMGHNLDIIGSAGKASTYFEKLLIAAPEDPRGNYMYGTFLAGAGQPKKALPYLQKALSLGVPPAAYALGMTYLSLGDKEKALENLEAYQRSNPDDPNTARIIDAIRSGKLKLNSSPK